MMEAPSDLISKHIKLYPQQIHYLETIDENISTATRKAITMLMQHTKNIKLERQLLLFALGLMFIGISTVMELPFNLVFITAGVCYLGFSIANIAVQQKRRT